MGTRDIFTFKQFSVSHAKSSMKVGTDAILLGSWVDVSTTDSILDIGSGCGIIALMLAQRSQAKIDAIDNDPDSIEEASLNFKHSPWASRIHAHHISLQNFQEKSTSKYDLIVSNPPFFQNSLLPSKEKLKHAKHNVTLSYCELLRSSAKMLNPTGRLAVIIPSDAREYFINTANSSELHLSDQCTIHPSPSRSAIRFILVFDTFRRKTFNAASLIIRTEHGAYSDGYMKLTRAFHPFLPK